MGIQLVSASALYFSTTPRERILERAALRSGPFRDMAPERLAMLGTPRAEITTALDVSAYRELKMRAMLSHRTQFGPGGPMAELPREEVQELLGREHFVRVSLPWSSGSDAPNDPLMELEADLGTASL